MIERMRLSDFGPIGAERRRRNGISGRNLLKVVQINDSNILEGNVFLNLEMRKNFRKFQLCPQRETSSSMFAQQKILIPNSHAAFVVISAHFRTSL